MNMKKIFVLLFLCFCCVLNTYSYAGDKDVELVLYSSFLQKLVATVFPITFTKEFKPDLPIKELEEQLSFNYKISIAKPVLYIYSHHIQIDATVETISPLGVHTFPGRCRFVPQYNKSNKQVEFKVLSGVIHVKLRTKGAVIDLGEVDISPFIKKIKIPLNFGSFKVGKKTLQSQCRDVIFKFYRDKVVVESKVEISK